MEHKYSIWKELKVMEDMKEYKLDILDVSNTKKVEEGAMQITKYYKLYFSGLEKGTRAKEGVRKKSKREYERTVNRLEIHKLEENNKNYIVCRY